MIQDWLKALKDGAMGLIPMLVALLFPQAGQLVTVALFVGGAVIMILGVTTNVITKDFSPVTIWGKVLKDFILGLCTSAVPIIQNGVNGNTTFLMILGTIGITALSIFANVISQDVTTTTIFSKILKDFGVLGLGAIGPIFSDALSHGGSLGAALGTAAIALLTVAANVIKSDFLGLPSSTAGGSLAPTPGATKS